MKLWAVLFIAFSSHNAYPQTANLSPQTPKPFKGIAGVIVGTSLIGIRDLSTWSNQISSGNGIKSNGFLNIALQGLSVQDHFVSGFALTHESLFTSGKSGISPYRISVAIHMGRSFKDPYNKNQLLTTLGFGFSELTLNLHSKPPLSLQTKNVPNNIAYISQVAFWLNPKFTYVRIVKVNGINAFKVGLDASLGFYFGGNYRYGYSKGQGHNSRFIGYALKGVPDIRTISLNIGGYIGI